MRYETKDYENFLLTEIDAQVQEYETLVNTRALVLKARGDVFVGKFLSIHESGSAVFKVRNSENLPRKGSFWTSCYFIDPMGSFKNWGDNSWINLRKDFQRIFCDCSCQWVAKSEDPEFCLVGINGLDIDFVSILEEEKPVISFGPKDPPLEYLYNLLDLVRNTNNPNAKKILEYEQNEKVWNPRLIAAEDDLTELLNGILSESNLAVIQGPPGTGKTYRMASLAARLLENGNSVLVTALTNQALIELAKKKDLELQVKNGLVSKTSLTYDEIRALPGLQPVLNKDCNSRKGHLTLASFYVSSGWAKTYGNAMFDYIIMDEASQALLPMIAAARSLGSKLILIGDQNQLSPIVITNDDVISRKGWGEMICGFKTVCKYFDFPSAMLKDSFRLTTRAAKFTGIFYNGLLDSRSNINSVPSSNPALEPTGGPVFIPIDMENGNKADSGSITTIVQFVDALRQENPKAQIAVLSKFRDSVREIVHGFITQSSIGINDALRVDTVDKVQGLTVDYCIFFIPNSSVRYSLSEDLFNVATSRAVYNTIIFGDRFIMNENMPRKVRDFLSQLTS